MNRAHRRANMSNKNQPHATQSFAQLVGQANLESLKPYVEQMVVEEVQEARRNLAQFLLSQTAKIQTRLTVLEEILTSNPIFGVTKEDLAQRSLDVEDAATGHIKTEEPIQKGDLVRMSLQLKRADAPDEKFGKPANILLHRVACQIAPDKPYQMYAVVEEGLIGAVAGETRDFVVQETESLPDPENQGKLKETPVDYTFRVKVDRVSRNPQVAATLAAQAKPTNELLNQLTTDQNDTAPKEAADANAAQ